MFSKFADTLVFFLLWTAANAEDVEVCVFLESCVLPCPFPPGDDPVIHWTKEPEDTPVHIYYKNQHQLHLQHESYRDRTSLSDQGIRTGDTSLQLHEVNVSDEGRYKCYVSTIRPDNVKEAFVHLKVHAPGSEVSLQQEEERLLCRSENIYPKPDLTWTFSPEPLTNFTSSETGLFSVNSSVPLTQRPLEEYSCNVSTVYSWRSATYRRNPPVSSTGSEETVMSCASNSSNSSNSSNASTLSLVWTFNSAQTIMRQTGSELVYSETWDTFVKLLDSGDLRLKGLTEEHTGLFSCKRTTDRETFFIHTQLTVPGNQETEGNLLLGPIIGTLGGLIAVALMAAVVVKCILSPRYKHAPILDQKAWIMNQNTQQIHTRQACNEGPENNHSLSRPLMNGDQYSRPQEAEKLNSEQSNATKILRY